MVRAQFYELIALRCFDIVGWMSEKHLALKNTQSTSESSLDTWPYTKQSKTGKWLL